MTEKPNFQGDVLSLNMFKKILTPSKSKKVNKVNFRNGDIDQLYPYKYDKELKEWCLEKKFKKNEQKQDEKKEDNNNDENENKNENKNDKKTEKVIVMSFNVWFSNQNFDERQSKLLEIMKDIKPDFFCFQEVTERWIKNIVKIPFIQETYGITDISRDLSTIGSYGVFIGVNIKKFNILDVKICNLQSFMSRKLLSIKVQSLTTNDIFWINTVHLESKKWNAEYRINQLDMIFNKHMVNMGQLKDIKNTTIMFMGDFNFRDNDNNHLKEDEEDKILENEHLKEDLFVDCWKQYCNDNKLEIKDGWTRRIGYRYDRILMNIASKYNVKDFKILGDAEKEMPSDHKGVVVYLQL